MRDRGYFIQGDLRDSMIEEAREEARAEAEAAYYDAISEVEDSDELRGERHELIKKQQEFDNEIARLRREIEELEGKRDHAAEKQRFVERRMRSLDPEVVVEIRAHNTNRYGWSLGTEVKKAPPLPEHDREEDITLAGVPISDTVKAVIETTTDDIDPEEYDDREVVGTLTFENPEDDDPQIEFSGE